MDETDRETDRETDGENGRGGAAEAERERRLRDEKNVWLCTVRDDGTPHLTPIWFVYLDGTFLLCTGAAAVKTRNVRTNPAVALGLEDADRPLVAEGGATVHERPYPRHVVDAFRAKFGWDITRTDDPDGPFDALWEVPARRWLFGGPQA
jgi:hypothetical protein